MKLLSVNADAKTSKGLKRGILTGILYLAPHKSAGPNVCPYASPGCIAACLFTAGRAAIFPPIIEARIRKTREFFADRAGFVSRLENDISALVRMAKREKLTPAVRLNGTSDFRWHALAPNLFTAFRRVRFYDYTKDESKVFDYIGGKLPSNYHLTFSLSETERSRDFARFALAKGVNVAVVFRKELPKEFLGARVVSGDENDARFFDRKGVVVGLTAKGRAKNDRTGFVVDAISWPRDFWQLAGKE